MPTPRTNISAITFSDRPRLVASSTQSIDEIAHKTELGGAGRPHRNVGRCLYGPGRIALCALQAQSDSHYLRWRRQLTLYTLREIKQLAQESDVQIYAIGLFETFFFDTLEAKLGKKWLSEITDATGGIPSR